MANEAVIIELLGDGCDPIRYTVADGTAIPKGSVMQLSADRTALITAAADNPIVGIAASEKVISDGSTTLAVYTNGIFDVVNATAAATLGAVQAPNGVNTVTDADADDLIQNSTLGYALETGGTPETIAVRVLK